MGPHTPATSANGAVADAERAAETRQRAARRRRRELEHRTQQTVLRLADRELRRVHADGDAACAGRDVIARQRTLVSLVELSISRERERVRGDHAAGADGLQRQRLAATRQKRPSRTSNLVPCRVSCRRARPTRRPTR